MDKEELKNKCTERAKIFQQAMESCHSSSPIDCIEWFADRIAELEKENAELKEKVSFLKDNLRVARKDREDLQLNVAKGLKEFVKDYPATSLRYLANEKYVEQLIKAKEIIKYLCGMVRELNKPNVQLTNVDYSLSEAEQFLNSEVEK